MSKNKVPDLLHSVAAGIGKGIIAGIAGTAAITLSQMIEMRISGRKSSTVPADAASKVLNIKPEKEEDKPVFSQEVHWTYGTSWGLFRAVLDITGLKGLPASLSHFAAIWGTALVMEPGLKVAPPIKDWEPKTLAIDAMHHAVYACVAGLVYDAIE